MCIDKYIYINVFSILKIICIALSHDDGGLSLLFSTFSLSHQLIRAFYISFTLHFLFVFFSSSLLHICCSAALIWIIHDYFVFFFFVFAEPLTANNIFDLINQEYEVYTVIFSFCLPTFLFLLLHNGTCLINLVCCLC